MTAITTLPEPLYAVGYKEYRRAHLYTVGSDQYPSVTKILGIIGGGKTNALMIWARRAALKLAESELVAELTQGRTITVEVLGPILARADRQPDKIKTDAGDLGQRVHSAIDDYIVGKPPRLEADTQQGFDNFMAWLNRESMQLIQGDTVVASVNYGFGGRLDALAVKDDQVVLLDWKTSNAMREEYPLQVAAYAVALQETYGISVKKAFVVRFGKKTAGDFEPCEVNLPLAWEGFHAALKLHHSMRADLWVK